MSTSTENGLSGPGTRAPSARDPGRHPRRVLREDGVMLPRCGHCGDGQFVVLYLRLACINSGRKAPGPVVGFVNCESCGWVAGTLPGPGAGP
jgi:hypothetical protein